MTAASRIPYHFNPVPQEANSLVTSGVIQLQDVGVLAMLLQFWRPGRATVWATNATMAAMCKTSEDTVCRSLARLADARLIKRERVQGQDSDSPENRTGWRWRLAWLSAPMPAEDAEKAQNTEHPRRDEAGCTYADLRTQSGGPIQKVRKAEKFVRTNDLPQTPRQETPEQSVVGRAIAIAERHNKSDLVAFMQRDHNRQNKWASRDPVIYLEAIERAASSPNRIRTYGGWLYETIADLRRNGFQRPAADSPDASKPAPPPPPNPVPARRQTMAEFTAETVRELVELAETPVKLGQKNINAANLERLVREGVLADYLDIIPQRFKPDLVAV